MVKEIQPLRKRLQKRPSDAPTAENVAIAAGVSTATVSRYLANPASVSEKRGILIRSAIESLGYIPHGAAQALASQHSKTMGVIVPTLDNAIFAEGIHAFQRRLQEKGYTLFIASSDYSVDEELAQAERLITRGVDGLMLVGAEHHPQLFEILDKKQLPYLYTWSFKPQLDHPCIGFDNYRASARLTEFLLQLGHTEFAAIPGITRLNDRTKDRLAGCLDTLKKADIFLAKNRIIECKYDLAESRQALRKLLENSPRPTAIVCGNDIIAMGALLECQTLGVRVPEDVSIVGFDDVAMASHIHPALTTMQVPSKTMGEKAADFLLAKLSNEPVTDKLELEAKLVVRETTAAVK
ncbi:LacI family transcriptional regulator [Enterovibrio norvegicus FF-33]|uniref:LacI family DNA-binding transcriptional regulator n=1 Tax=Enterovibrio TaxID=188143 RepID=UPI0002DD6D8A|nr:LacI family DNA-binding transcriptional regulator [Enterovibrio norvegicus]OEE66708.1 LacI family transcriptional regulator [Enterovibrio norvegicus FF-33]OEE86443.1 LacI family transcriptional regulator [Enterovibrio norvegicus FF-162]